MSRKLLSQNADAGKSKQMSLSSFLGCSQQKVKSSSVRITKQMNPIYIDSESDEDGDEGITKSTDSQKCKENNITRVVDKKNILVKKYLYDDDSKSPLASMKPKNATLKSSSSRLASGNLLSFETPIGSDKDTDILINKYLKDSNAKSLATKKIDNIDQKRNNSTLLTSSINSLSLTSSPSKISLDDIESSYQVSMKSLDDIVNKASKERNKYSLSPLKNKIASPPISEENKNIPNKVQPRVVQDYRSNDVSDSDAKRTKETRKSDVSVVFEHGLSEYLCDLSQSHHFKTSNNEENIHVLKSSLNFFKNTYGELMEKYCNIVDQIPADYFNSIAGFETGTFLKLKIMRQKLKAKKKLLQNNFEKQNEKQLNISIKDADVGKKINANQSIVNDDVDALEEEERQMQAEQRGDVSPNFDIDELENEEREMKAELNGVSSTYIEEEEELRNVTMKKSFATLSIASNSILESSSKIVSEKKSNFKELLSSKHLMRSRQELINDLCDDDEDDDYSQQRYLQETICLDDDHGNDETVLLTKSKDVDNDCELDDLLKDIQEQDAELHGKNSTYNMYSYKDFEEGQKPREVSAPAQRITFPVTNNQRSKTPELDEDGFPIYDPEQFEVAFSQAAGKINSSGTTYNSRTSYSSNVPVINIDDDDIPSTSRTFLGGNNLATTSKSTKSTVAASAKEIAGNFHANVQNDGITGEFDGKNYEHSQRLMEALRVNFGLKSFRTNQLQVINAALTGHDCFVLMPTGGGKSLCYQLPSIMTEGVTIVVSPLKSLISDQVQKMASLDIYAKSFSGDISLQEQRAIYCDLETTPPRIKLLYVTPEKISSSAKFQDLLDSLYAKNNIARFVIDEAHCVSQWGHDFRPDYKRLGILKKRFSKVPTMALTATATPRVRMDILKQLHLIKPKWFLSSFNRSNLKYTVLPKKGSSTLDDIKKFIFSQPSVDSGIIYCLSRKECDDVAKQLSSSGIRSCAYHAGLADSVRESRQKDWVTNKYRVICATIAFGMGIDKPDVRFVLHYSLPKSIEGYYQEAGRAGRDGDLANCILYYNYGDMMRYRKMMDMDKSLSANVKNIHVENLNRIVGYCENVTDCRRAQQLDYFGEHFTRDECMKNRSTICDNCMKLQQYTVINPLEQCRKVALSIKELCSGRSRFTLLHIADVLKGSNIKKIIDFGHNKTRHHGALKEWDKADIQRLLRIMVTQEFLREDLIFSKDIPQAYVYLGPKIDKLMNETISMEFAVTRKLGRGHLNNANDDLLGSTNSSSSKSKAPNSNERLTDIYHRCYSDLLDLCRTIAAARNVTMASIMNIQAIKAMAEQLPETEADMCSIPHVTKANFDKYGEKLLEITRNYAAEKLCLLMDLEDLHESTSQQNVTDNVDGNESYDEEDSRGNGDWAAVAASQGSSHSGSRGSYRGGKRKRNWRGGGGGGAKKYRKSSIGSSPVRKAAPKKGFASPAKKRGSAARGGSRGGRGGGGSSWIVKKTGTSGGFAMMPIPISK